MIKKTIELSSGPARLSVAHRQLVIERPEQPSATVPVEDVGMLIVDHPAVSYTHAVFTAMLEAGATVVLCGGDHHPVGVFLPIDAHSTQAERHRWQIEAPLPLKKQAWARIVRAKIEQQAAVLTAVTGRDSGLIPAA